MMNDIQKRFFELKNTTPHEFENSVQLSKSGKTFLIRFSGKDFKEKLEYLKLFNRINEAMGLDPEITGSLRFIKEKKLWILKANEENFEFIKVWAKWFNIPLDFSPAKIK